MGNSGECGFRSVVPLRNCFSVSLGQPGFSLSAFWPFSVHLFCSLSIQSAYTAYSSYLLIISTYLCLWPPQPCLCRLSAVPPASANGSFPLNVFAQTPERTWSFSTSQAINHYGSVSLRSCVHHLSSHLRLEEWSSVLLWQWGSVLG